MRLSVCVFGREVFALVLARDELGYEPVDHDNTAAQVELAADVPVGFQSQRIPSLEES